ADLRRVPAGVAADPARQPALRRYSLLPADPGARRFRLAGAGAGMVARTRRLRRVTALRRMLPAAHAGAHLSQSLVAVPWPAKRADWSIRRAAAQWHLALHRRRRAGGEQRAAAGKSPQTGSSARRNPITSLRAGPCDLSLEWLATEVVPGWRPTGRRETRLRGFSRCQPASWR